MIGSQFGIYLVARLSVGLLGVPIDDPEVVESLLKETRIKFSEFTVVLHDFKGYETDTENDIAYYFCSFNYCDTSDATLYFEEEKTEVLIARKDTVHLSEDLNNRVNNSTIQIIPKNSSDRFEVSLQYETVVNEIIDYRELSDVEREHRYQNRVSILEKSKVIPLPDSANFHFKTVPHTSDMVELVEQNGEWAPKMNPKKQLRKEQDFFEAEQNRMKKKYNLHDTLVEIPSELYAVATLTDGIRLYDYFYATFVFRIDRYEARKFIESKYISIGIAYGC